MITEGRMAEVVLCLPGYARANLPAGCLPAPATSALVAALLTRGLLFDVAAGGRDLIVFDRPAR